MSKVPYGVVKYPASGLHRLYCKEGVSKSFFETDLGPEELTFKEDFFKDSKKEMTMVIPEELIR